MLDTMPCYSVHHELALKTYFAATADWAKTSTSEHRCGKCWLRAYNCFCDYFEARRKENEHICGVRVVIYYHYSELGRSANTMHLFPALYPSNSETVIFGDVDAESNLIKMIIDEQLGERNDRSNVRTRTCILYPTSDSIPLPEWVAKHVPSDANIGTERPESQSIEDTENVVINLVVLDGTYSQAARQVCSFFISFNNYYGSLSLSVLA
jgi:DTW domain-containing protein YfiP